MSSATSNEDYYVPHGTHWPIIGSIGLSLTVVGIANFLLGHLVYSFLIPNLALKHLELEGLLSLQQNDIII